MKNPFSRKQLNNAKPFDVERPSYRKVVVDNYTSDCQWAFCMVILWTIFVSWFSWLLLTG